MAVLKGLILPIIGKSMSATVRIQYTWCLCWIWDMYAQYYVDSPLKRNDLIRIIRFVRLIELNILKN